MRLVKRRAFDELIKNNPQRTLRDLARIHHAHRPARGVSWIRERLEALRFALGIQRLEIFAIEQNLTAHRNFGLMRDRERNAANGAHVLRDLFAGLAVAARARLDEPTIFVDDLDAAAVELRLDRERDLGAVRQTVFDAAMKFREVVRRVRVVEREHALRVRDLHRAFARRTGNALRG